MTSSPENKQQATSDQIKAVANSTRLRIMRLCNDREWTNKELATRLKLDPSTVAHHLKILVNAELLTPMDIRQGPTGAYEKPYRSSGLSWRLILDDSLEDDESVGEPAPLRAFRHELREAGLDSSEELTRFHLHLNKTELTEFLTRFRGLIDEYVSTDNTRIQANAPSYGGFIALHRLRDDQ